MIPPATIIIIMTQRASMVGPYSQEPIQNYCHSNNHVCPETFRELFSRLVLGTKREEVDVLVLVPYLVLVVDDISFIGGALCSS
jgi:hypothetical protein